MPFTPQNAGTLIPQKPPFVFVDDEKTSCGRFAITENNMFVKNGIFSTAGMVESMAQTAAAGTGYLCRVQNKGVPVGYIGALQKLEVMDWPPAGKPITMEISLITNILQVSLVSGMVKYDGKIMATCEMKIFINPSS
jgi:predicted hotdog family 3-hydroxylacyl-ACP dehydratase